LIFYKKYNIIFIEKYKEIILWAVEIIYMIDSIALNRELI
jgi:hypothetical protein